MLEANEIEQQLDKSILFPQEITSIMLRNSTVFEQTQLSNKTIISYWNLLGNSTDKP